ncbi:hypothetical protein P280DRAFT_518693 [Massarina eburnea CBS 473.64]|uniref:Pleckstrin homology domain-containing protein n=1 Tax=Massarina eburnea CBS 473.64 TaxID=1395130 RepID=A0A6A6S1G5_9PLEO|nr:hypothetical protein P280DRAFT_518693 [Massarina eburnea CBS 473.64]
MPTDYYSDNEAYMTNQPLPPPSDTPYLSVSRRTSRYGTPSNDGSLTAPLPPDPQDVRETKAAANEDVSVFDPRRFTPTLHANLVSEILNLRRELDSKHSFIEDLETSYHGVQNENDSLAEQLSASVKENRTVKRQLQQLENGTLSALEEVGSERDNLKKANADLKEKLEGVQKKLRSQEEDSTRVHDMWANEKEMWSDEKSSLERRVHISESRLKTLLDEIALYEAVRDEAELENDFEDLPRDSGVGPDSDAGSLRSSPQRKPSTKIVRHSRNISSGSYRSLGRNYRWSSMSGVEGRSTGINLADELAFDEEDEELDDLELDSDDYPENEMRARRHLESRQSMRQDEKAKRVLGLSSENEQVNRDNLPATTDIEPTRPSYGATRSSMALVPQEVTLVFPPPRPVEVKPKYVDTGVQPSPPQLLEPVEIKPKYVDTGVQPSPPQSPVRPQTPVVSKSTEPMSPGSEVEANQRRKRVSAPFNSAAPSLQSAIMSLSMISSSSQTVEEPLSPPATPVVATSHEAESQRSYKPQVASISTQTERFEKPATESLSPPPKRAPPPVPIGIPSIAIYAPSSAPQSPKEPILPPGTKSIATQTTIDMKADVHSTSMQTEPIRVDKRPVKLPPHLLPSAIRSTPGTPEQAKSTPNNVSRKDSQQSVPRVKEPIPAVPSARQDLMTLLEKIQKNKAEDRYPGNNDNGPLAREKDNGISRPFRSSSLFAGFDGPSSDEEASNADMSDGEDGSPQWSKPMLSSRNNRNGRMFNNPPTPVQEEENSPARASEDSIRNMPSRISMEKPSRASKPTPLARPTSIRRSAMIQSGTTTHMRSQSPTLGPRNRMPKPPPPFPVPTRSSSRGLPLSKSEGSQSPTLRNQNNFSGGRRPYGQRPQRQDSIRKVRSAAVMQKQPTRRRSRSPPPSTPVFPPSPSLPPLPHDMVAGQHFGHRRQPSTNTSYTGSASVGSVGYQASVVDAIAVAMVGEWMWKYVRKRKAFGVPESPTEQDSVTTSSGVRHKRWVWISPYERAILWSSKQPTTGTALLGKSGRKLTIQSVLDVADNTPSPRNAGSQPFFNRSILILTPARALKFTTSSRERHYMWLTALSFLAHSSAPMSELVPPPEEDFSQHEPRGATLRRSHIHDSVRLAKGKVNPVTQRYQPQAGPLPELHHGFRHERPLPAYADPPVVPRGPSHGHGRKRSSTGPSAPPPNIAAYRSFSHQQVPSVYSSGSSDMYSGSSMHPPSAPSSVYNPQSVITSTRPSESSTSTRQHFFDTMGTMRMEAFIDDSIGRDPVPPRQGFAAARMAKRRGSQWSGSTNELQLGGGIYENSIAESNDSFGGF